MDYVQELLLAQAEMAAQLGGQTQMRLRRDIWVRRRAKTAEEAQDTDESGREDAENSAQTLREAQEERPEQELERTLSALEQTAARAAGLAAQRQERVLRQTQQAQSVSVPLSAASSRGGGGVMGEFSKTLETSGIAGRQTAYAMSEISRFFERDARRYGG